MLAENRSEKDQADAESRIARILDDYLVALENGRSVSSEQILNQHPDLADQLTGCLQGLEMIRRLPGGRAMADWSASHQPQPVQLGPYRLGRVIGRGAMGTVYRAKDIERRMQVAVKVLDGAASVAPDRIDRFRREARAAASLDHPNIVPVYSIGCQDGVHYYAMQRIDGVSLEKRIAAARSVVGHAPFDASASEWAWPLLGAQRYQRLAEMGLAAAQALHASHSAGVVHRDIKPSNLLLDDGGRLWITDFGLARVNAETTLTRSGELVGTIRYMSPEQAMGDPDAIDQRSDVYALGITLYELASLQNAFDGDDVLEVLELIRTSEPLPISEMAVGIPPDLARIIEKAISPSAQNRYSTADAMAADLARFLEGYPLAAETYASGLAMRRTTKHVHRSLLLLAVAFSFLWDAGGDPTNIGSDPPASEHVQTRQQASVIRERDEVLGPQPNEDPSGLASFGIAESSLRDWETRQSTLVVGFATENTAGSGHRTLGSVEEIVSLSMTLQQSELLASRSSSSINLLTYAGLAAISDGDHPLAHSAAAEASRWHLALPVAAAAAEYRQQATLTNNLAELLWLLKCNHEAVRFQSEAVRLLQHAERDSDESEFGRDMTTVLNNLGLAQLAAGKDADACQSFSRAQMCATASIAQHPSRQNQQLYGRVRQNLKRTMKRAGSIERQAEELPTQNVVETTPPPRSTREMRSALTK